MLPAPISNQQLDDELVLAPSMAGLRLCSHCHCEKPVEDFPVEKTRIRAECRACKTKRNTAYKRWRRQTHHEEYVAECIAEKALHDGLIKKQNCLVCHESEGVEMHHDDYSKPLKVLFLCHSCHKKRHEHLLAKKHNLELDF